MRVSHRRRHAGGIRALLDRSAALSRYGITAIGLIGGHFQLDVATTLRTLGSCEGGKQIYHSVKRTAQAANSLIIAQPMRGRVLLTAQALFPGVPIEQARIKTGATLPANWYPGGGSTGGMTLGKTVYIRGSRDFENDSSDMELLLHELVHVRQQILLGEDGFGCAYGDGYVRGGGVMPAYLANQTDAYHLNPLEAEAYQFDSQVHDAAGNVQGSRIPWVTGIVGGIDAIVPYANGVLTAFFNRSSGASMGIYHSPDGQRLTTTRPYSGAGRVSAMIPFGNGVVTAFYNHNTGAPWGVYRSADGANPGGGANTTVIYNGQARVERMIPYGNGIIAAFYNHGTGASWGIYRSPDGSSLTGGTASGVYSGQARVDAMIPYGSGVLTAFYSPTSRNGWGIYYSPDGNNIGGGGQTVRVYSGTYRVDHMVQYGSAVITSFYNGSNGRPAGVYLSTDGTRNITSQRIYNGDARVDGISQLGTGVLVAFRGPYHGRVKPWGVYLSSDGASLAGGANNQRMAYELPVFRMVRFNNDVFIASTVGVIRTTSGDVYGSPRVYP